MQDAFEVTPELLQSHADALRALARRLLHDEDAAEDVVQDTWLVALRHPPARQDALGGWLRAVTRSLALKRLRGEGRRVRREERGARSEVVEDPQGSLDAAERARVFRAVTEAVLGLEEPYRNTVLRRYFEDLPPREIARSEGLSVSTVKSRLQRAVARLRTRLGRDLGRDGESWTRALALSFGLPLPLAPVPLSDGGSSSAAHAGTASATGAPFPLTAIMAAKIPILALGGVLTLVALCIWRVADAPSVAVRQPIDSSAVPLARAELAQVEDVAQASDESARAAVPERGAPGPARVWPASVLPGPTNVFVLTGEVVDENDLPVSGAELFLGPLGHPLNRVGNADEGGRFAVKWLGRGTRMDVAFRAGDTGATQRLSLSSGVANTVRTTAPKRISTLLVSYGEDEDWTRSLIRLETGYEQADQAEAPAPLLAGYIVPAVAAAERGQAPTALVDDEGFVHFVGLDDSTACPAGFYRHAGLGAIAAARALQIQDGGETPWAQINDLVLYQEARSAVVSIEPTESVFVEVRGIVHDGNGKPVADALVTRLGPEGQAHERTTTAEDGSFLLGELPPGDLRLRAGGGNHGIAFSSFTASAGQSLRWEPLLVRAREVRGRLVNEAGQGLPGWHVVALAQNDASRWSDVTATDEAGFFAIPNCTEQGLRLLFADGEADGPFPNLVVEDVWPDTTPEPFTVPADGHARGDLALTLVDAFGEPVMDAFVRVWHPASRAAAQADVQDDEGRFRLDDLPPGEYRVEIGSSRHGWLELPGIWMAGEDVDLGVVAFPEPGRVAFEVEAPGRDTFDDVRLEIWKEHVDVRNRVRSIEGVTPPGLLLPEGDYVATARSRSGSSTTAFSLDSAGIGGLRLRLGEKRTVLEPTEFDLALFEQRLEETALQDGCKACHPGDMR